MSLPVALVRRLVVSVLLVGLVAAWLGRPGPERMRITAEFARAGLNVRPGDEVRVRGVPVGTISSIEVDREAFTARYTLSLDADAPIAADTTAALVPKTLFGDKYVELQSASTAGELLRDGAHIPLARTSAPTEVQEVLDRLQPVLAEVDPVTFANVIASTAEGLDGAGADIAALVDSLPDALATLTANQTDLSRIFRTVPGIAGTLEERAGQLVQVAESFGTLAATVDRNEDELARFVTATADLSTRAAELLSSEGPRLDRVLASSLSPSSQGQWIRSFAERHASSTDWPPPPQRAPFGPRSPTSASSTPEAWPMPGVSSVRPRAVPGSVPTSPSKGSRSATASAQARRMPPEPVPPARRTASSAC
jgi:virulence factor Mce-like protein